MVETSLETRLGKRKDRPPPTDPPPQKSGTSKSSKKNKPKKSSKKNSKKRKTTDEESPTIDFVGTVGVAEENEVEEPAKDVEDREKEKEREEENGDEDEEKEGNSDESQEENGDKDEQEEGNSDEEVENKDEEKIQEEEDTGEEENETPEENRGQNENENQEEGEKEPPLEAESGNVDGDGEAVLGQGEEMVQPQEPHFFQPLFPGFQTYLTIPIVFFSKHIQGKTNGNTWTLTSDATDQTWQVIQEERRLTRGWKEFTEAHDLRIGDIVIFKLKGSMVFHVTPFGPSFCDIQYTYPNSMEEVHDHQNNTGTWARFSYSWDYCFMAEVTDSNVREDKLDLPVGATGCNALNKECKKAKLVNIEGKAWNVSMRFNESGGFYYIKGWRKFCAENKCHIGDSFVFNVVGDGNTWPLMCVCAPSKECLKSAGDIASSSRVN